MEYCGIAKSIAGVLNLSPQPIGFTRTGGHYCIGRRTWYGIKLISAFCRMYASVNWVNIGSYNGLSPIRRQAIIWTSAGL